MKKLTIGIFALGLLGLARIPVQAEDANPAGACSADVKKYCSDVQPGGGRIAGCLNQNQSALSSGCQSQMKEVKQKVQGAMKNFKAACGADLQKFCAQVEPRQGRKIVCLRQHQGDLTPACREALSNVHPRGHAISTIGSSTGTVSPSTTGNASSGQPFSVPHDETEH